VVAELRALRLRGEELPDAGIPEDVAMFDADLDAGDAGPPPDAWAPDAWAPDAWAPDAYDELDASAALAHEAPTGPEDPSAQAGPTGPE
jgi:hypothetical protein